MFCATEDMGRSMQRFCWPPQAGSTVFAVNFDQRSILPPMVIPSVGLPSPSKCFVMPPLPQQPLSLNFPPTPLSAPFQHMGNFGLSSLSPVAGCNSRIQAPNAEIRRLHPADDDASNRQRVDRCRRRSPVIVSELPAESKVNESNRTGCTRRRGTTTTSFTIADILEGRIGSNDNRSSCKRLRTEPPVSPSLSSDSCPSDKTASTGCYKPSAEVVRPWNKPDSSLIRSQSDEFGSRRSSSSSVFSPTSPAAAAEHYDDDDDGDDDECDDEDDEDIDVDDFTSTNKRHSSTTQSATNPTSSAVCPLGALLRMANETNFETSPGGALQDCLSAFDDSASDGNGSSYEVQGHQIARRSLFSVSAAVTDTKCFRSCRKRRKTRTAFTNQQIAELERWFGRQKYLTPADRDEIAAALRLSAAQVITWFQNRRAKLKRDLEELKADVAAAKALGTEPSTAVLDRLAELTRSSGLQQQQQPTATMATGAIISKTDVADRLSSDSLNC